MKISVFGAGAMGCLFAALLSDRNEVTLFDIDQNQIDAINANGVSVEWKDSCVNYKNVKAVRNGTQIGTADLVIVFVKGMYTPQVMTANASVIGPETIVLTLQNGAGNDRDIMKYAKAKHTLVGTTTKNSVNLGGGKVGHNGTGTVTMGSTMGAEAIVHKVAEVFRESGIETVEAKDIQRIIWSKLFVNLSINSLTALLGVPIGALEKDPHVWNAAKCLIGEAVEVAKADGETFDIGEVLESVLHVCRDAGDGYASMYQDRINGRKTEIDRINGAIVNQAKLYGIPTPCNAMMVELIHGMENAYPKK